MRPSTFVPVRRQKTLIDRAADALGPQPLPTSCLKPLAGKPKPSCSTAAISLLSAEEFRRFTSMLDKPPASSTRLRRLLNEIL